MIKIDKELISTIKEKAVTSQRKRSNHNFHREPGDTLQRMLNVMNPETYVQPHMHKNPDKREAFILLEGKVAVIEFNNEGTPIDFILLDRDLGNFGCEIPHGCWHTIICLDKLSVLYEVKDGPYDVKTDKQFAPWAPHEGDKEAMEYNLKIIRLLNL